jgi:hypothetical protein
LWRINTRLSQHPCTPAPPASLPPLATNTMTQQHKHSPTPSKRQKSREKTNPGGVSPDLSGHTVNPALRPREQLCNRSSSNKQQQPAARAAQTGGGPRGLGRRGEAAELDCAAPPARTPCGQRSGAHPILRGHMKISQFCTCFTLGLLALGSFFCWQASLTVSCVFLCRCSGQEQRGCSSQEPKRAPLQTPSRGNVACMISLYYFPLLGNSAPHIYASLSLRQSSISMFMI